MTKQNKESAISEGITIVERLLIDQEIANRSWAHFIALYHAYSNPKTGLKDALSDLRQSLRLSSLTDALLRDTLMSLFRVTDNPGEKADRFTLCRISKILTNEAIRKERMDWFARCLFVSETDCNQRFDLILDSVPPKWVTNCQPKQTRLYGYRNCLRPLRDKLIAHSLPFPNLQISLIAQIDDFRSETEKLVCAAQWIFKGSSSNGTFQQRMKETEDFWGYAVQGFKTGISVLSLKTCNAD